MWTKDEHPHWTPDELDVPKAHGKEPDDFHPEDEQWEHHGVSLFSKEILLSLMSF